jgi:hypothetical protein
MKNRYEIRGDVTVIKAKRKGETFDVLIDTKDLPRLLEIDNTWLVDGKGYVYGKIDQKRILLHRFIAKTPDGLLTDHINHNKLDNRKCNLRIVTNDQNQQNRKGSYSQSGHRGVYFHKPTQKWTAKGKLHGKLYHLGSYDTVEEALRARISWEREHMPYSTRVNKEDAS